MNAAAWRATLAATALMGLVMGSRSAFGLFVSPLNTATGLGLGAIGLAVAVGQLAVGVAQPAVAVLAERHGAARVMGCGAVLLAAGTALLAQAGDFWSLTALMLLTSLACSAVGSNAMLMGEVARRVGEERRGFAAGLVGAGGSAGQLLIAPATQGIIVGLGWRPALWATAALMLLALPLLRPFAAPAPAAAPRGAGEAAQQRLGDVLRDRRFRLVCAGFAMCGFHVAFLTTHLPGVLDRCGLPSSLAGVSLAVVGAANIVGSIGAGLLMRRWSSPLLLGVIYGARAAAVAAMLAAPPTAAVMLAFAFAMGLTYIAPLAPTAQLLARYFGVRRLGTLVGVTMVVHQIGGFAGSWLGGLAVEVTGSYRPLWLVDIALALLAAALQWPLREAAADGRAAKPAGRLGRAARAAAARVRSARDETERVAGPKPA